MCRIFLLLDTLFLFCVNLYIISIQSKSKLGKTFKIMSYEYVPINETVLVNNCLIKLFISKIATWLTKLQFHVISILRPLEH